MTDNPKAKHIEPGQIVMVWEDGFGFATGDETELGRGVIVARHKGFCDTMKNNKETVYEIRLDNGQTIHGCHNHFYTQSYYFMTKEEYNDMIVRQIEGIDAKIASLSQIKDVLQKKIID